MPYRALCALLLLVLSGSAWGGERGIASWYGPGFTGNRTACGNIYNEWAMVAAHKSLRCGTRVIVINLNNHRQVVVTIRDRGPFVRGRIIDLSHAAKNALGMGGTAPVLVVPLR